MAIKRVGAKIDFIALEHEILDFWKAEKIFQKRKELNRDKPRWKFIDGPITANNPMGVHHAWGRTLKDIFHRYKAMSGYQMRYQNGFDCQGLWVEIEVEKELGFSSKREVEAFGIENFVDMCKERVLKYSKVQTDQSIRLGYWMDWDNSYFTMSEENNYTIWAFLKKLFELGKIYRGVDSVPWSGRSGTSYSQMEIIEGRRLVAHDSLFVRFPLRERINEYLLVWTTTPWTLTSNVAVAVSVNLKYVKLRASDGSLYYFAIDNLKFQRLEKQFNEKKQWVDGVPKLKTIEQLFKERGGYTIEGTINGAEMIGWEYDGPFDNLEAQSIPGGHPFVKEDLEIQGINAIKCHRVIDGGKDKDRNDVVVAGEGTGIVHIAPGCGDIDHKIGKKLGLVDLAPLDEAANFIDGFGWITGMNATAEQTRKKIIKDLDDRGFLLHVEKYPHIYPHCWRSGDELVFRIVEEWYINMDWRDDIKKLVDQITWIPDWGQDREHEWLDNMGDWMISKKRFWGLALPIWTFEDDSFLVVGSREELKELAVEGWEEFEGHTPHRPWIDKVKIKHPVTGLIGTRIPDVGNPWLDAGIVPYSTLGYINDRENWEKWFPADFVTENFQGQFRNWFYSLLAMSTIMEGVPPFKTLLGHALVKDESGRDMHKSWGNAIWFEEAAEHMGVDVMRWMYASQNVEKNLLFGYSPADEVRKKLITLWNSYSFFATYASVDKFDPDSIQLNRRDNLTILDKWIISKLNSLIIDARKAFEAFRVDQFTRKLDRFLEDLSNWYIRRSRRRFWKSENDEDKITAYETLYEVLVKTIRLLAPVLPFITEAIYRNLVVNGKKDAPKSIHLTDFPEADLKLIDEKLVQQVDLLKKMVELGRSSRNRANLKIRQPLSEFLYFVKDDSLSEFLEEQKFIIMDELNVKSIKRVRDTTELVEYIVKPNLNLLGQKVGKDIPVIKSWISENSSSSIINSIRNSETIRIEKQGKSWELSSEDFIIHETSITGISAVSNDDLIGGISTELTESLIKEGIVRDVIRQVQIMRKDANFAVEDRISVHANFDGPISEAINAFKDYFFNETLTVAFDHDIEKGDFTRNFDLREHNITISIERNKKI
jgi:isoleucyl-tRNA synthetase